MSTIRFEKSISKILYQTLCLFSKIKEMGFSLCRLGHTPGGGTWGCLGVKFFSLNMVVWHIKLKGMVCRTGNKLNVPRSAHHSLQFDMSHDHVWKKKLTPSISPYGQTCELKV